MVLWSPDEMHAAYATAGTAPRIAAALTIVDVFTFEQPRMRRM